jgi:hypothetical protein
MASTITDKLTVLETTLAYLDDRIAGLARGSGKRERTALRAAAKAAETAILWIRRGQIDKMHEAIRAAREQWDLADHWRDRGL